MMITIHITICHNAGSRVCRIGTMYIEDDSENLLLTYPKFIDRKQKKVTMFYKKKKNDSFQAIAAVKCIFIV